MRIKSTPTYQIKIFIAGDYDEAIGICRRFCRDTSWCVSVSRRDYVYTGGMESGVCIEAISYSRFPEDAERIKDKIEDLAEILCRGLCQKSYTIIDGVESVYYQNGEKE